MEINVILEYFDKLTDENAMFIEFKDGGSLLVDKDDIIRANGDVIEIKSKIGCYITEAKNVSGLKISTRTYIMQKAILQKILEDSGDE